MEAIAMVVTIVEGAPRELRFVHIVVSPSQSSHARDRLSRCSLDLDPSLVARFFFAAIDHGARS
jgi:hypothetical protein